MDKTRVRFAPSPTGFLHVGNARTALFNWLFARQKGAAFVLRIEDTDAERSSAEYEKQLLNDLRWLGLDWDEGPDVGGGAGPYKQSQRAEIYAETTRRLIEQEKAFYCFCPPEDLEKERQRAIASGRMPIYNGKCRGISLSTARQRLKLGERAVVRLKTEPEGTIFFEDLVRGPLSFDQKLIGDPVLVRSNGVPAYNYAAVIDDAQMRISHVIRGEDHISNTPLQILIYKSLSLRPPRFAHLSMVMGRDNTRLSKRHGATSVNQFRRDGVLPSALFNYLALLGWAHPEEREILSREELIGAFNLKKVSRSAAIFDYDKLHWLNRKHMKALSVSDRAKTAYPFLADAGFLPEKMTGPHWRWMEEAVEALMEGADRFADLPDRFAPFFDFDPQGMEEEARASLEGECGRKVLSLFGEKIAAAEPFDYECFVRLASEIQAETGCKGRDLYHPLRIALTARASGLKLELFIPLVEEGSKLDFPKAIKNCRQRVNEVLQEKGTGEKTDGR